ncbi:MAG: AAA family ATPase [Pseudomonadales bacterium]|nr:AAA family ATPase [Pseudomonadales bacterium]
MKTIAFYNLKGGVGKTAAAVNIAYLSAQSGLKTLLWDLDPQGSTSWYFEHKPRSSFKFSKLVQKKSPVGKIIEHTSIDKLDIIPADLSIRHADVHLQRHGEDKTVSDWLKPLSEEYAMVVIDCAPNISRLSESIFDAVDAMYIPLIPTHLSMQTFEKIIEFFKDHDMKQKKLRPFFSMVDRRKSLHREFCQNPPVKLKKVLSGYIPYAADIERMGTAKAPIGTFAPRSVGAIAYNEMWREIKGQLKL